jgi:hypothetical protein
MAYTSSVCGAPKVQGTDKHLEIHGREILYIYDSVRNQHQTSDSELSKDDVQG